MNTIIPYGKAICYSGYRRGQSPKTEIPTVEQIGEDLELLVQDGYRYLRMYDPNLHARRVLEAISIYHLPLQCMIGIDSDPEVNNPDCPWEKQEMTEEELTKTGCAMMRNWKNSLKWQRSLTKKLLQFPSAMKTRHPGAHTLSL
ncbi:MAG: hypothetical protein IJV50_06165 [Lachnospiraceae bacterium]|nr:hypothetical protein [Lachnospiraceae bacterium]